jgi:hypothetical protein
MSEEVLCTAYNSPLPLCGKPSCITLYRGDNCYFCDIASQMLASAVAQYGVSTDVLREVDIDSQEEGESDPQIVALPTIRICDVILSGLPEEDIINDAVIRVLMKDCFSEHSSVHQTAPLCNTRSQQVAQKSI